MLRQLGGVVHGLFVLGLSLLWGTMAWYLGGFDAPVAGPSNATVYGLWALAAIAFLGGTFTIYRSLKHPRGPAAIQTGGLNGATESESELVARVLSKLGNDEPSPDATPKVETTPTQQPEEEDEVVARLLAKLQQQKAEREARDGAG
jgi:hypothetical protein